MKRTVLPALFGLAALWMILGTASRAVFKVESSAGLVCRKEARPELFAVNSVCWSTGEDLTRGKRYRITIRAKEDQPWIDKEIGTGVGGFEGQKMGWAHPLFVFFRRNFGERWFTPIARIGEHGNDEYPLHPVNGSVPDETTRELVAEITARRDGPLFIFVNDAVLPVPNSLQVFYNNNQGAGSVTVEEKIASQ